LFLFCFGVVELLSQEVYHFRKGLAVFSPARYGREAVYVDALAYQLYNGTLKTPSEGSAFEGAEKWQTVMADSADRLIVRGRRSGYIYLTYTSDKERMALINVTGNSGLYVNGEPHAGDPYRSEWLKIPVRLKKGLNEFYVRGLFITASLSFPQKSVLFNNGDPTLPSIVLGAENTQLQAAVTVINTSPRELKGLQIKSRLSGAEAITNIPAIPAMSIRKVAFPINRTSVNAVGKIQCQLELIDRGKILDTSSVVLDAVTPEDKYSITFKSDIDGSLQYFAVTPQTGQPKLNSALFFSVHGAGVEAIGQARAYKSKDWGTLVAPTNRRPRGFNWEDWGRLDAMEVLAIAKEKFKPDPRRIYLTGHSMGGHGTWFLGATYPDQWAAIAPCAGYPSLKGYGSADGLIPDSSNVPIEKMLLRSSNQSDVVKLATNYKPLGVYIFHGDSDRVVSVDYGRQMRKVLAAFHSDMSYYEYPGGSHWFGDQSVDWKPLFDFFQWHCLPADTALNTIDFITASPGISASNHWITIYQQIFPLEYSRVILRRTRNQISGTTSNIRLLKLDLSYFQPGATIKIELDGGKPLQHLLNSPNDLLYLSRVNNEWIIATAPDLSQKGPHRYGTFKDAFNNNMIFVYSTGGTKEENEWSFNKARYDAETWYYRGNGAVDIIPDTEFSLSKYKDRGVILFGNKSTNKAWNPLLSDCPIQVERNKVSAGSTTWNGDTLSVYFVWPIKNSPVASVAVMAGSGIKGMRAADANQYFAGASGFPDFMIYSLDMLKSGVSGMKMAGFFDHDWKLSEQNFVVIPPSGSSPD